MPAAGAQPVAALREAAAQADVRGGAARGGDPAPVDRQRLGQAAGDAHGQRRVRARADRRDADGRAGAGGGDGQQDGGEQGGAHPAAG